MLIFQANYHTQSNGPSVKSTTENIGIHEGRRFILFFLLLSHYPCVTTSFRFKYIKQCFYFISNLAVYSKKQYSNTDFSKLEAEIASLRRQLNQAKRERAVAPSKEETLQRFMVNFIAIFTIRLTTMTNLPHYASAMVNFSIYGKGQRGSGSKLTQLP